MRFKLSLSCTSQQYQLHYTKRENLHEGFLHCLCSVSQFHHNQFIHAGGEKNYNGILRVIPEPKGYPFKPELNVRLGFCTQGRQEASMTIS